MPESTPRAVVMIAHGLGEHGGRYGNLVERLLLEGYAVYAIDHQGFGRSGGRRGHVSRFRDYAQDMHQLNKLVRAEQPGLPFVHFGHSMGGLISLDYAQTFPKDADYWIIQAPAIRANISAPLVFAMRLVSFVYPTFSMVRPPGGDLARDPEVARQLEADPLAVPVSSARWLIEFLAAQKRVTAHVTSTPGPLLMLQGTADNLVIPANTHKFFDQVTTPDKTYLTYDDYFHELHNEVGKEKPLGDIVAWLDKRV